MPFRNLRRRRCWGLGWWVWQSFGEKNKSVKVRVFIGLLLTLAVSGRAQTLIETFGSGTNQFSIEFVTIGNPGNAALSGFGAVNYTYRIGKYETSRSIVEKANTAGSLGLTMSTGLTLDQPVIGLSWNEAARFVNWLNTSKGYQAAYKFTTSGRNDNLTLWGAGESSGTNQFRHKDAFYFLPSIDEWFKAAYYDPTRNSGAGGYWSYATQSNSSPTMVTGGTAANTAVYGGSSFAPANVTNAGGLSYYGTMAQNGNAWDLLETAKDGVNNDPTESRGIRGGKSSYSAGLSSSEYPFGNLPTAESSDVSFRVAMVPEPSAGALLVLGAGVLAVIRRRKA